jgi:hypothetical protein
VKDGLGPGFADGLFHQWRVTQATLYKLCARIYSGAMALAQVIKNSDLMPGVKQLLDTN